MCRVCFGVSGLFAYTCLMIHMCAFTLCLSQTTLSSARKQYSMAHANAGSTPSERLETTTIATTLQGSKWTNVTVSGSGASSNKAANNGVDDYIIITAFGIKEKYFKFVRYEFTKLAKDKKLRLCLESDCSFFNSISLRQNMSAVIFANSLPDNCTDGYTTTLPTFVTRINQSLTIYIRDELNRVVSTLEYDCKGYPKDVGMEHCGNQTKYYVNTRENRDTENHSFKDHFLQSEEEFSSFMCGSNSGEGRCHIKFKGQVS